MSGARRSFGHIRERKGSNNLYVRFFYGPHEVERAAGPNRTIADRKLAQVQVLLAQNATLERILEEVFGERRRTTPCPTLREAVPMFLVAARGRLKASTVEGYERVLRAFAALPWAERRLDEIPPSVLKDWRASRAGQVSPATLNRCLAVLSSLWTWAVEEAELLDYNPVHRIKRLSEKGRERETYLTEDEARALVEAASADLRPVLVCALATGMRVGEITSLRWNSVDFARRFLTVEPEHAKSRRARTIPVSAWLEEILRSIASGRSPRPVEPVFLTSAGKPFGHWEIRKRLDRALDTCAGIPEEKKPKVTMHVLRHTAASLMVAAGVPIFDVAKILGHSTIGVTMRYAHFAPQAGRAAIDALDRRLRPPEGEGNRVAERGAQYGTVGYPPSARPVLRVLRGGLPSLAIRPGAVATSGQSSGQSPSCAPPGPT